MIDKIEIVKRSQVRRAKLYHVRRKAAKEISKRMKMAMVDINDQVAAPEEAKAE
jgi:ribosomal protein L19